MADKFIAAFIAGDLDATTALYSPDVLFWGTESPDLGTRNTSRFVPHLFHHDLGL